MTTDMDNKLPYTAIRADIERVLRRGDRLHFRDGRIETIGAAA